MSVMDAEGKGNMNRISDLEAASAARPAPAPRGGRKFLSAGSRVLDFLYLWQARIDERRELIQLDERVLKDAGMSRADAMLEANKPFWRGQN